MKIIIYQNREVYKEESKIGNDSENKVETLEFEFPEEYEDFTKYIEFQIKGEKYVDLIEDNKYVITREVAKYGKIKTQVVLKKNTENDVMIFKSDVFTLTVSNSINATENLIYTVGVDLIEKIVTKNNEQDTRLNNLELDNTTNKENISNLQNDNTTNKSDIKSLQDDNEVNKTDISNIKQEQTTQNINISNLQTDNTSNKSKILVLEAKNTKQDTNIQKNAESIAEINAKDTAQDSLIEELQTKVVNLEAENTSLKNQIPSGEATGNPIHLSDSSDMECEIVVKGNAEQETVTDNLFNNTWEQGLIMSETGENIDSDVMIRSNYTRIFPNHLYNISRNKYSSYMSYRFYDKDKKFLGTQLTEGMMTYSTSDGRMNANESSMTFTIVNTNVAYMRVTDASNDLSTIYTLTTEAINPDYPSEIVTVGQNGSVEIEVCNKNLFESPLIGYAIMGSNTEGFNVNKISNGVTYIAKLKNNQNYYIKKNNNIGDRFRIVLFNDYPVSTTYLKDAIQIISDKNLSKYGFNSDKYNYVAFTVNADSIYIGDCLAQLELSSTATDYIPHEEQNYNVDVQEEMFEGDYFDLENGKEVHNWQKVELTGDEKINLITNQRFQINLINANLPIAINAYRKINAKSNYFKGAPLSASNVDNMTAVNYDSLYMRVSESTTLEEFTSLLKSKYDLGNPVKVYYKLAEPRKLDLTENQKQQLQALQKAKTYKNVTNISMSGIGTLKVNYKKDLETLFNNINSALLS